MKVNITDEIISSAAIKFGIEPGLIYSVYQVESSGNGFLLSGKPKILFEGHIFWRQLTLSGMSEIEIEKLARNHESILYKKWTRKFYYKDGELEYKRLEAARLINENAANCSASWGAFQIMGFNYRSCGFHSVNDFVVAHSKGIDEHINSFFNFLISTKLFEHLKNKNWDIFSRMYNGPDYRKNDYNKKLIKMYEEYINSRT